MLTNSIIDNEGKIVLFGIEDFINNIVKGNLCFICGKSPEEKIFNNEHVLPNWILKKYSLHDKFINLTNQTGFKYGSYTIPCCEECNSTLGREIETPVKELIELPYEEIITILQSNKDLNFKLFQWLNLIFLKTHLKDSQLNLHLDRRKGDAKIGGLYDWEGMHHIHTICRSHYTNAKINENISGSLLILPAIEHEYFESFDFADNLNANSIMLRLNNFSVISVLNDSSGTNQIFFNSKRNKLNSVDPIQLREIFAHFTFISTNIKNKPRFYSSISPSFEQTIKAVIPESLELEKDNLLSLGEFVFLYTKDLIGKVENQEKFEEEIKSGKRTFLFGEDGKFIKFKEP